MAAQAAGSVLFPIAQQFNGADDPAMKCMAAVVTAGLLERGEAIDEGQATAILVAGAGMTNDAAGRLAAARGLAKLRSKAGANALVGLLSDPEKLVRLFAFDGLKRLSGDGFGYSAEAEPGAQAGALAKWTAWAAGYEPQAR